jgi:hypothetical protein
MIDVKLPEMYIQHFGISIAKKYTRSFGLMLFASIKIIIKKEASKSSRWDLFTTGLNQ